MIEKAWPIQARWARSILGMVLAGILVACSASVHLVSELNEAEANEVLGLLLGANISATKTTSKTGIGIQVESGSVAQAIEILRQNGLPRERRAKLGDVFKKENLISSPLEERARYLYALAQELEHTLTSIDGVVTARVHVVLPERIGPMDPSTPSSASVFLKFRKGYGVENVVVPVRALVANGIPGLSQDRVAVVLVPAASDEAGKEAHGAALSKVLFLQVHPGSATAIWVLLGLLAAGLVACTAVAMQRVVRTRGDSGMVSDDDRGANLNRQAQPFSNVFHHLGAMAVRLHRHRNKAGEADVGPATMLRNGAGKIHDRQHKRHGRHDRQPVKQAASPELLLLPPAAAVLAGSVPAEPILGFPLRNTHHTWAREPDVSARPDRGAASTEGLARLPFVVRQVACGNLSSITTEKGVKFFEGASHMGYELERISEDRLRLRLRGRHDVELPC